MIILHFLSSVVKIVKMEPLDLLELDHLLVKEEWRSVTTTSGALSVMIHGAI